MPSLISSRQIAGHPTARAIACASVVLPVPGGPLTTTRVGSDVTSLIQPAAALRKRQAGGEQGVQASEDRPVDDS